MELVSSKEFELMSYSEKKKYLNSIKEMCFSKQSRNYKFVSSFTNIISPLLRNYKIEIEGEENIPKNVNVIFAANHSNSHDAFTTFETLSSLNRRASILVASDDLSSFMNKYFEMNIATLVDRKNSISRRNSILNLTNRVLSGFDVLIFSEGTWNLHPYKLMHNLSTGVLMVSAITGCPIVPVIFEYIEKKDIISSERDLYEKCVIRFGKPINYMIEKNIFDQADDLRKNMEYLRKKILIQYGIYKNSLKDVDQEIYLNHTYLKKFKAFGYLYDSLEEQKYLLSLNNELEENEYHIDNTGTFCPGITEKNEGKKFLK